MGQAIGQVLSFAVGVAISPVPIIAVVLMLGTRRGRSNGVTFIVGWVAGLAIVGTIVLLVSGGAGSTSHGKPADWESWLDVAVGVLFVLIAVREWRRRPHGTEEAPLPKWMQTIDAFTPARAGAVGIALSAINPKNLLLVIGAASAIAQTGSSAGTQAVALAVFVVIATLGTGTPVVLHFALGERSRHILDELKGWMGRNNAGILAVICLLIGAKLIGDAIGALAS